MSLPFFSWAISVNSLAMIWWCPQRLGSFSLRHIKSCHISWTKYKKLSWQSLMCCIHSFSTSSLNLSVVKKSFFMLDFYFLYVSIQLNLYCQPTVTFFFWPEKKLKKKLPKTRKYMSLLNRGARKHCRIIYIMLNFAILSHPLAIAPSFFR